MKIVITYLKDRLSSMKNELLNEIIVDKEWTAEMKEYKNKKMSLSHKWTRVNIRLLKREIPKYEEAIKILSDK